jgi:hypothetical protein
MIAKDYFHCRNALFGVMQLGVDVGTRYINNVAFAQIGFVDGFENSSAVSSASSTLPLASN